MRPWPSAAPGRCLAALTSEPLGPWPLGPWAPGPSPLTITRTMITHHTYPDLIVDGGRLARTDWAGAAPAAALRATLAMDSEAIVLMITGPGAPLRGLAPGGLGPEPLAS